LPAYPGDCGTRDNPRYVPQNRINHGVGNNTNNLTKPLIDDSTDNFSGNFNNNITNDVPDDNGNLNDAIGKFADYNIGNFDNVPGNIIDNPTGNIPDHVGSNNDDDRLIDISNDYYACDYHYRINNNISTGSGGSVTRVGC
jgi:hypothetical protein